MTTPLWCLVAVTLIPVPLAFLGGYFRQQQFGKADNKNPRPEAARLEGTGSRVYAAQANAWEAVAMFTVAIMASHLSGVSPEAATPWALSFVGFRILHAVFYIADVDLARSGSFLAAVVCWIGLLVQAASM